MRTGSYDSMLQQPPVHRHARVLCTWALVPLISARCTLCPVPPVHSTTKHKQDHLRWERAHILGFSMGGMVAQSLAVMAPHRVHSLTLLGTSRGGLQIIPHNWSGLKVAFKMVMARSGGVFGLLAGCLAGSTACNLGSDVLCACRPVDICVAALLLPPPFDALLRTPEDAVDATLRMHFRRRTLKAWVRGVVD